MYSRVFLQILDSSLAENWQTRHVFEDLLKLANIDGVVDMTRQSISRRLNMPSEIVDAAITALENSDPHSRDPEHDGKRIIRLDGHRDWGWRILNFQKYERIRVSNDMREFNARRMANYREKKKPEAPVLSPPQLQSQFQLKPKIQSVAHTAPTCRLHDVVFPEELNTDAFKKVWGEWEQHRTEIKKKLTPLAVTKQLNKFAAWGHDKAIQAIETAIENGWQGVFEPTENRNGKSTTTGHRSIVENEASARRNAATY